MGRLYKSLPMSKWKWPIAKTSRPFHANMSQVTCVPRKVDTHELSDSRREQYRLATFQSFPNNSVMRPTEMSAAGFYYSGYKDRVKCFSCGGAIENWMIGDNPEDRRWHKPTCDLANMTDTQNIPMQNSSGIFKKFLNEYHKPHDPIISSSANSSRSQRMPLPQSHEITLTPPRNSSNLTPQAVEDQRNCQNPLNPHMRSLASRTGTFNNRRGIRWPSERLRATPEELANAGLFYIGERDRVKCWYCNGGLQNWDYNDDPWVENAKWFPSCEYVRNSKGISFIEQVASQYPNVVPAAHSHSRNSDVTRKVQEAMTQLDYVRRAKEMGISIETITEILTQKYRQDGEFYREEGQFLDAVFAYENLPSDGSSSEATSNAGNMEVQENTDQNEVNPKGPFGSQQSAMPLHQQAAASPSTDDELVTQLRSLAETRFCRMCKKEVSNIVIIPCGHICTCQSCIDHVTNCPLCGCKKTETTRTYRA